MYYLSLGSYKCFIIKNELYLYLNCHIKIAYIVKIAI